MALPNFSAMMPNGKKVLIGESSISIEPRGSNAILGYFMSKFQLLWVKIMNFYYEILNHFLLFVFIHTMC